MINEAYESIIDPVVLRARFNTEEDFYSWLGIGKIEDLKCMLKAFGDSEMYEDCILIKKKINEHN